MRKSLLLLMIVASPAIIARGDGKFFVQDKIPPGVPYQRAFLLHYEGQETLILQSKYDLPSLAAVDSLGWIVPVPTVPEIANGKTLAAWRSFWAASRGTQPRVYHMYDSLPSISLLLCLGGSALMLMRLVQYLRTRGTGSPKQVWNRWAGTAAILLIVGILMLGITRSPLSRFVEIIEADIETEVIIEKNAGIYDVKVIRGPSADATLEWLKENGFRCGDKDRRVLQSYADRGWCFVTAKVVPTAAERVAAQGMAAPLILKFQAGGPIYPLVLTATAGTDTETVIYTLSDTKLACGGRLPLHHAKPADARSIFYSLLTVAEAEQWPLLRDVPERSMMLCKVKGRLTPEQMKQDLEFTLAPNNEPYRKRKIVW